jgi:hypothetical protein
VKENKEIRNTHTLQSVEEARSQDSKRKPARVTHTLESGKKQVKSTKESERGKGTHALQTAKGDKSQGSTRKWASEDSLSRKWRGRDKSTPKENEEWGALTNWRVQREWQIGIGIAKTRWVRGTHVLQTAKRGTGKNDKRKRARGTHRLESA